jgi:hypothetical protein
MISLEIATNIVRVYLSEYETRMNKFGYALPHYKNPNHEIVICKEVEYDFGWVFDYNTRVFLETGNISSSLLGNGPLIVDRFNGQIYTTGSAHSTEFYIAEFRKGGSPFVHLYTPQKKDSSK